MINLEKLKEKEVPEEVVEWMKKSGANHVKLYKAWNDDLDSDFSCDYNTLENCLAYALQQDRPKKPLIERLLGRLRRVRVQLENDAVDALFHSTPDFLL